MKSSEAAPLLKLKTPRGAGGLTKFCTGMLLLVVQTITLKYITFDQIGTPFIYLTLHPLSTVTNSHEQSRTVTRNNCYVTISNEVLVLFAQLVFDFNLIFRFLYYMIKLLVYIL